MKKFKGLMTSLSCEWATPQWLFDKLNEEFSFTVDVCAKFENAKSRGIFLKRSGWIKKKIGISIPVNICWMNPPFSKAKEMFEHFFKVINKGVAIYRCDNMETKLWQEVILPNATWIFIPLGRICYEGMEGKGSRFPSALIGIGVNPPTNLEGISLMKR